MIRSYIDKCVNFLLRSYFDICLFSSRNCKSHQRRGRSGYNLRFPRSCLSKAGWLYGYRPQNVSLPRIRRQPSILSLRVRNITIDGQRSGYFKIDEAATTLLENWRSSWRRWRGWWSRSDRTVSNFAARISPHLRIKVKLLIFRAVSYS